MFKTNPILLGNLLDDVEARRIQLPDFQRGWVWDDDRVRGLLASISRGFPIGAVMMLPAVSLSKPEATSGSKSVRLKASPTMR